MNRPHVVDFETRGIEPRPKYPPKPVGIAIWPKGKHPRYYAWGHPVGNGVYEIKTEDVGKKHAHKYLKLISKSCTEAQAKSIAKDIWTSGEELLFHHAKFDLDVAEEAWGLKLPPWHLVHDTLYSLFLSDPHASSLSLKPSAERILGMKPEEKDAIREWLVAHKVIPANAGENTVGENICNCAGDVVAAYAIGDLTRTWGLHAKLYPDLDKKMKEAYDRERKLMPILLKCEQEGLRFDIDRAERELPKLEAGVKKADEWLRKRLGDINLDSPAQLSEALDKKKIVTHWTFTKTGKMSTSQKEMTIEKFKDKQVFNVLKYRSKMGTALELNLRPWSAAAQAADGYIYTTWKQVRSTVGRDSEGARSGRITCSKFANVPKDFEDKNDGFVHPAFLKVPELPLVRGYLLPDDGEIWGHIDWSQQEFRIIAHYAEGELLEAYKQDPRIDFHALMQANLLGVGVKLERRPTKITNFSIKYGSGATALAGLLGVDIDTAKEIIAGVKRATPSVTALDNDLKEDGRAGKPLRTWGGRLYYCEPPKYVEKYKRQMSFEYKLLSYLIQGSGADAMKESIIRWHEAKGKDSRMLVTVYDELNLSAHKKALKREMKIMRDAMEGLEFDVPMLTDCESGPSWGDLSPLDLSKVAA